MHYYNHSEIGAPLLQFHGNTERIVTEQGVTKSHVSISHDGGFALATVILENHRPA